MSDRWTVRVRVCVRVCFYLWEGACAFRPGGDKQRLAIGIGIFIYIYTHTIH